MVLVNNPGDWDAVYAPANVLVWYLVAEVLYRGRTFLRI